MHLARHGVLERGRIEHFSEWRWAEITKKNLEVPPGTLNNPVWSACVAAWRNKRFSDVSETVFRCVPEDFPGNILQPSPQGPSEDWKRYPDHVSDLTFCSGTY